MKKNNNDFIYPSNVNSYLKATALDLCELYKKSFFHKVASSLIIDNYSTSPIESLFYISYKYFCEVAQIRFGFDLRKEVKIIPQCKIGKYRCDFLMINQIHEKDLEKIDKIKGITKIIIELDGHNFHEKTENQRRLEKERDRFFQSKGFTVLRFTGKEVYENSRDVVLKCLTYPNDPEKAPHIFHGICIGAIEFGECFDIENIHSLFGG